MLDQDCFCLVMMHNSLRLCCLLSLEKKGTLVIVASQKYLVSLCLSAMSGKKCADLKRTGGRRRYKQKGTKKGDSRGSESCVWSCSKCLFYHIVLCFLVLFSLLSFLFVIGGPLLVFVVFCLL